MKLLFCKYVLSILLIVTAFSNVVWSQQDTPTSRFLQHTDLVQITQALDQKELASVSLLLEAATKESDKGFFGYHGSTQNYRIFQDVIRAVLEEKLGYAFPKDFYFLRIPGDKKFDFKNGMTDFYSTLDHPAQDKKIQKIMLSTFLLEPLKNELNLKIRANELTQADKAEITAVFDALANRLSEMRVHVDPSTNQAPGDCVDSQKIHTLAIFQIFSKTLQSKKIEFNPVELRSWVERTLLPHNLLKTYFSVTDTATKNLINNYFYPFWDLKSGQRELLISLNIPLFGNYARPDESTLGVVLNNSTLEGGDKIAITLLKEWFKEIGIPEDSVDDLMSIAYSHIPNESQGVLYQFFDIGPDSYSFMDKHNYVSYPFGVPAKEFTPSLVLSGVQHCDYMSGGTTKLQRQLRLLTSNQTTLNPYSHLKIVRYDFLGEQVAKKIIAEMRAKLGQTRVNERKIKVYKAKLEKAWL